MKQMKQMKKNYLQTQKKPYLPDGPPICSPD